jgi:hypothetical protein
MCACRLYFIKEYLAHPPMIIFVYPVLVACSSLAHYVFNLFDLSKQPAGPVANVDDHGRNLRDSRRDRSHYRGRDHQGKVEILGVGSPGPGNRPRQISFCTATQPR